MRHISDGVLRRLLEEPLAVPDATRHHLETCGRCRAGSGKIAENAAYASRVLMAPPGGADTDAAWAGLQARLADPAATRRPVLTVPRYPARRVLGTGALTGIGVTAGLVAGGVAAAATLSTVFAPDHVASVNVGKNDVRAIADVLGLSNSQGPGDVGPVRQLPFGTVRWTAAGHGSQVASIAAGRAATHLPFTAPATLPAGVGSGATVYVQPKATATITFSASAGKGVGGTRLAIAGGPGMLVQYGGRSAGTGMPTLAIVTMRRPVATSTGATTAQLENFLLSRPGVPADLARQIRLLGNLGHVLPVPVPSGAQSQHVRIDGAPAVVITASGEASAVVWESRGGIVHAVGGLLDSKDVLNVARQIG